MRSFQSPLIILLITSASCVFVVPFGCATSGQREPVAETKVGATSPEWEVRPGDGIGPLMLGMDRLDVVQALGEPDRVITPQVVQYHERSLDIAFDENGKVLMITCGDWDDETVNHAAFHGMVAETVGIGAEAKTIETLMGEPVRRMPVSIPETRETWHYPSHGIIFALEEGRLFKMIVHPIQNETKPHNTGLQIAMHKEYARF